MSMRPVTGWLEQLPRDRLLAEFSLWSADLAYLAQEIERVDQYVDLYHIDVADGHFAPQLLFFPDLISRVRTLTARPIHVHLMAADTILLAQIEQFVAAGADLISLHLENRNLDAALALIARCGAVAGLMVQLPTPVAAVAPYLERIQMLTLLGVPMGIKGVGLDQAALPRLREARVLLAGRQATQRLILAADGGIREQTVPLLRAAGAETIVMGSLAFGAPDLAACMNWVHALAMEQE